MTNLREPIHDWDIGRCDLLLLALLTIEGQTSGSGVETSDTVNMAGLGKFGEEVWNIPVAEIFVID